MSQFFVFKTHKKWTEKGEKGGLLGWGWRGPGGEGRNDSFTWTCLIVDLHMDHEE